MQKDIERKNAEENCITRQVEMLCTIVDLVRRNVAKGPALVEWITHLILSCILQLSGLFLLLCLIAVAAAAKFS